MVAKVFVLLFALFFFLMPEIVFAQTACCSQNGGQYACDTSTNKLYCKDGTVSKECICKMATPTPAPSPSPIPTPIPTLPSCVPYSSFDGTTGACKCNSGYIVKDNACVTYAAYCIGTFGGNSIYDSDKNICACASGYGFNSDGKSCISYEDACHNNVGDKSFFNSENNTCNCYPGYSIQDHKCQPIPTTAVSPFLQEVRISLIPTLVPKISQPKVRSVISPVKVRNVKNSSTLIVKDDANDNFVAVKKHKENVIEKIISVVKNLLSNIF